MFDIQSVISELKSQRDNLDQAIDTLSRLELPAKKTVRQADRQETERRAKLSAAMKLSWLRRKKQKK